MNIREALTKMAELVEKKKLVGLNVDEQRLMREVAKVIVNDPFHTCELSCSILDVMMFEEAKSVLGE